MPPLPSSHRLRRLMWRAGRKVYCAARGEQRSGSMEQNGESFLQRCVAEGTDPNRKLVVFDIGANVGAWTASLLRTVSPQRQVPELLQVHAFEPVPSTAQMLAERLSTLPGRDCVFMHQCALSSEPGSARIGVYFAGAGINTLHFASDSRAPEKTIEVPVTTLAIFCEEKGVPRIHLAKCDTEGNDARVLAGAAPLLKEGRIDVIQFEYNHRWVLGRSFLKDVFDLIDGLPYSVARVDPARLTMFDRWHPELERFFHSNYALVRDEALPWFPVRRGAFDAANTYA